MGSVRITTSMVGTVGGQSRKLSVSDTAVADEVIDIEINVSPATKAAQIFHIDTDPDKLGTSLPDFKQLVLHNTGTPGLEVIIYLPEWGDGAPPAAVGEKYLSMLLFPGQIISLPNPRVMVWDTVNSAADYEAPGAWDSVALSTYSSNDLIVTDGAGKWDTTDLAGSLNTVADTTGLVPGSMRFSFYSPAYQSWGLKNNKQPAVTSGTDTQLKGSILYDFRITVDGVTSTIEFTTLAASATEGITVESVLTLINASLYAQGVEVDMAIVDGDIRATSRSRISSGSQVTFAAGVTKSVFGEGIIPSIGNIDAEVDEARMTDENDIMWETKVGGVMTRKSGGSALITSYEENGVAVSITGAPANSTIDVAYNYRSPHGGDTRIDTATNLSNSLIKVYARSLAAGSSADSNIDGKVRVLALY